MNEWTLLSILLMVLFLYGCQLNNVYFEHQMKYTTSDIIEYCSPYTADMMTSKQKKWQLSNRTS